MPAGLDESGNEMTPERTRLLWGLLWRGGSGAKLRVNIPETSLIEDEGVRMTIFTGRDGTVMKRARQNTSIGAIKARLVDGMDETANAVAGVTCTPPESVPRLVERGELLAVCHRVHRRLGGTPDVVAGEPANPTLVQEFVPPLHDIRYAVEYHRASGSKEAACRVTCRRYDWRLRNAARAAATSRGPEVQLTDGETCARIPSRHFACMVLACAAALSCPPPHHVGTHAAPVQSR